MKKILFDFLESLKHNWFLYLLGILHLTIWIFAFITCCEVISGNLDVTGIVDLDEILFSYNGHEYTLFDMWFFMAISTFMVLLINSISLVNRTIFNSIAKRDYDRQIKSTK